MGSVNGLGHSCRGDTPEDAFSKQGAATRNFYSPLHKASKSIRSPEIEFVLSSQTTTPPQRFCAPQTHRMVRKLLPPWRMSSFLLALLTHGGIRAAEGALDHNPGSQVSCPSRLQQQRQERRHLEQADHPPLTPLTSAAATLLDRITGGANPNNRRRKHSSRSAGHQQWGGASTPEAIEISGAELADSSNGSRRTQQQQLDGVYLREWDVNGAPHFKRRSKVSA